MKNSLTSRLPRMCNVNLSIAALTTLAFAGFAQAAPESVVNVYSSRHYETDNTINDAFTKSTGIKVNTITVKEAAQLIERMKAEGKRSPADVLMTVDVGNLSAAKEAGLFQPMQSPLVDKSVPMHLRDSEGHWTAVSARARVIAYKKSLVKESEIKNYEDLASDKWKSKILVRSSNHVYNQSLVASLIVALTEPKAENWAKAVTANLARKPEGGDTDQLKGLAAGTGQIAIVNHYYAARLMASTKAEDKEIMKDIGIVFPNQENRGTHINVSGAGITKFSPNVVNARKYLDFWLSPESQALLTNTMYEYPAVPQTPVAEVLKQFGNPKFDTTPLSAVAVQSKAAVKLLDKAGWR